jgi:hypothetical protein
MAINVSDFDTILRHKKQEIKLLIRNILIRKYTILSRAREKVCLEMNFYDNLSIERVTGDSNEDWYPQGTVILLVRTFMAKILAGMRL